MLRYLLPLKIFAIGQLVMLVIFIFFPAIGATSTQLAADTAAIADTFWGWTWVVQGTRLWVLLGVEAAVLFATAVAFLGIRSSS